VLIGIATPEIIINLKIRYRHDPVPDEQREACEYGDYPDRFPWPHQHDRERSAAYDKDKREQCRGND
jgi:hypothetical protein